MDRLKGKIAVVTGSTSGIGIGIAKLYAKEGAKVIICGRRKEKGEAVVQEIRDAGGEAAYHFMDLMDPDSIDALMKDTAAEYGRIDVLVNNAANASPKDGRLDEVTLEQWDDIFDGNLRGTFWAVKCALPFMTENGGSIVNIGSMAACGGDLQGTAYAASKAGVDMLTKIYLDNICVTRYGRPEDIGHLCVYLGSDESYYMTGQILTVDGGLNTHSPTVAQFRELGSRTW